MRITIDDTDRGGHPEAPWYAEVTYGHRRYRAIGATPAEALDSLIRDNNLPADPAEPETPVKRPLPADGRIYSRSHVGAVSGSEVKGEGDGPIEVYHHHGQHQALAAHYAIPAGHHTIFVGESSDGRWDEFKVVPKP